MSYYGMRRSYICAPIIALALYSCTPSAVEPLVGPAPWVRSSPKADAITSKDLYGINIQNILVAIGKSILFPKRNVGIQCHSVNATLYDVPDQMVFLKNSSGSKEQRFGEVEWRGTRVFQLQLNSRDPVDHASPRCEIFAYPMQNTAVPDNKRFWYSLNFQLNDFSVTKDELIISQLHADDSRQIVLNPYFAIVVKGKTLRVEVRSNSDLVPSKERTKLYDFAPQLLNFGAWNNLTVLGKISPTETDNAYLTVWLNGKVIARHNGPVGYKNAGLNMNYVKAGLYHWLNGNPWDHSIENRIMLLGSFVLVSDDLSSYSYEQIRGLSLELMR